jgi:hypothetical protein
MVEEKRLKKIKWLIAGLVLIALIIGSIYVLSNKIPFGKSSSPLTDPERGIQNWIEAVNQRNINRVYDLAPDEIKQQRTLAQFKEDNLNNTFLQPDHYFINYTVIDKKQNATYAQIIAQIFLHQPADQGTLGSEVPIQYKFALYYEHGEWKLWTLKW